MEILEMRKAIDWTQERYAIEVGVAPTTFNRWERKKNKPHKSFLKEIERIYNREFKKIGG